MGGGCEQEHAVSIATMGLAWYLTFATLEHLSHFSGETGKLDLPNFEGVFARFVEDDAGKEDWAELFSCLASHLHAMVADCSKLIPTASTSIVSNICAFMQMLLVQVPAESQHRDMHSTSVDIVLILNEWCKLEDGNSNRQPAIDNLVANAKITDTSKNQFPWNISNYVQLELLHERSPKNVFDELRQMDRFSRSRDNPQLQFDLVRGNAAAIPNHPTTPDMWNFPYSAWVYFAHQADLLLAYAHVDSYDLQQRKKDFSKAVSAIHAVYGSSGCAHDLEQHVCEQLSGLQEPMFPDNRPLMRRVFQLLCREFGAKSPQPDLVLACLECLVTITSAAFGREDSEVFFQFVSISNQWITRSRDVQDFADGLSMLARKNAVVGGNTSDRRAQETQQKVALSYLRLVHNLLALKLPLLINDGRANFVSKLLSRCFGEVPGGARTTVSDVELFLGGLQPANSNTTNVVDELHLAAASLETMLKVLSSSTTALGPDAPVVLAQRLSASTRSKVIRDIVRYGLHNIERYVQRRKPSYVHTWVNLVRLAFEAMLKLLTIMDSTGNLQRQPIRDMCNARLIQTVFRCVSWRSPVMAELLSDEIKNDMDHIPVVATNLLAQLIIYPEAQHVLQMFRPLHEGHRAVSDEHMCAMLSMEQLCEGIYKGLNISNRFIDRRVAILKLVKRAFVHQPWLGKLLLGNIKEREKIQVVDDNKPNDYKQPTGEKYTAKFEIAVQTGTVANAGLPHGAGVYITLIGSKGETKDIKLTHTCRPSGSSHTGWARPGMIQRAWPLFQRGSKDVFEVTTGFWAKEAKKAKIDDKAAADKDGTEAKTKGPLPLKPNNNYLTGESPVLVGEIGTIKRVRIRQDGQGELPTWFLAGVEVKEIKEAGPAEPQLFGEKKGNWLADPRLFETGVDLVKELELSLSQEFSDQTVGTGTSCLEVVLEILADTEKEVGLIGQRKPLDSPDAMAADKDTQRETFWQGAPQLPAAALDVVCSLWQGNTTAWLRSPDVSKRHLKGKSFWHVLTRPMFIPDHEDVCLQNWYHQTLAKSSILEVLIAETLSAEKLASGAAADDTTSSMLKNILEKDLYKDKTKSIHDDVILKEVNNLARLRKRLASRHKSASHNPAAGSLPDVEYVKVQVKLVELWCKFAMVYMIDDTDIVNPTDHKVEITVYKLKIVVEKLTLLTNVAADALAQPGDKNTESLDSSLLLDPDDSQTFGGGRRKTAAGACIDLVIAQQQESDEVVVQQGRVVRNTLHEYVAMTISLSHFLLILLSKLSQIAEENKTKMDDLIDLIAPCLSNLIPSLACAIEHIEKVEPLHINTSEIRRTLYHSVLLVLQLQSKIKANKHLQSRVLGEATRLVPILWRSLDNDIRFAVSHAGASPSASEASTKSGLVMLIQMLLRHIGEASRSAESELNMSDMMNTTLFERAPSSCRHAATLQVAPMHTVIENTIVKNGLLEILMKKVSACMQSQSDEPFVKSAINLFHCLASNCISGGAQALTMSRASVGRRGIVQHILVGTLPSSNPCAAAGCSGYGRQVCARCRSVKYCSRECQIAHWKMEKFGHKTMCKALTHSTMGSVGVGFPRLLPASTWPVSAYYQPDPDTAPDTWQSNEWHPIWCSAIHVLTSTLNSLQHSEHVFEECVDFVTSRYQDIAAKLESLARAPTFCLGELEEASAVMALFAELSKFRDLPHRMPFILESDGLLAIVARLFTRCVDFFDITDIEVADNGAKGRPDRLTKRWDERTQARTQEEKQLQEFSGGNFITNQLVTDVINRVHQILRLCVVTIANLSIPTADEDEGLFSSSRKQLHSNIKASCEVFKFKPMSNDAPSWKTLADCFKICHYISDKFITEVVTGEGRALQVCVGWPVQKELDFLRERAIVVFMSQVKFAMDSNPDFRVRKEMLESLVHRDGYIRDMIKHDKKYDSNESCSGTFGGHSNRRSTSISPRTSFIGSGEPKSPIGNFNRSIRRDSVRDRTLSRGGNGSNRPSTRLSTVSGHDGTWHAACLVTRSVVERNRQNNALIVFLFLIFSFMESFCMATNSAFRFWFCYRCVCMGCCARACVCVCVCAAGATSAFEFEPIDPKVGC